jgi:hypothetical protein
VQTYGPGNAVDQDGIGHIHRKDIRQVQFEEVEISQDRLVSRVADDDLSIELASGGRGRDISGPGDQPK